MLILQTTHVYNISPIYFLYPYFSVIPLLLIPTIPDLRRINDDRKIYNNVYLCATEHPYRT